MDPRRFCRNISTTKLVYKTSSTNQEIRDYHRNKENLNLHTKDFMYQRAEFILLVGEFLSAKKISLEVGKEFYFDNERKN